jgi:hypothetical protein
MAVKCDEHNSDLFSRSFRQSYDRTRKLGKRRYAHRRKKSQPLSRPSISQLAISQLAISQLAISQLAISQLAISQLAIDLMKNRWNPAEHHAESQSSGNGCPTIRRFSKKHPPAIIRTASGIIARQG